jgi:prepilin-type N-terminal cleavage/methylation domain-containing protein
MRRKQVLAGFTLIELMVAISIMGLLSAVALPAFTRIVNRSKTAETSGNLDAMFKNAASYYTSERSGQGQVSSASGHCTVDDGGPAPLVPGKDKQEFPLDDTFRALGFHIGDFVYFSYSLASGGGSGHCDHAALEAGVYTFFANGDLDGDGIMSTFEMAAGSSDTNVLYHARSFHVVDELE